MAESIVSGVEYREIAWLPGYRFGPDGTVWSKKRQGKAADGEWKLRKHQKTHHGYRQIAMMVAGKEERFQVHCLILEAFKGPKPEGMEAAHDNGKREDNRIDNLFWRTPKSNWDDKRRHGTACEGDKSYLAKLTADQVREIRRMPNVDWEKCKEIGAHLGVTGQAIMNIVQRKTWKHLDVGQVK
jgi:hypothetical protein